MNENVTLEYLDANCDLMVGDTVKLDAENCNWKLSEFNPVDMFGTVTDCSMKSGLFVLWANALSNWYKPYDNDLIRVKGIGE